MRHMFLIVAALVSLFPNLAATEECTQTFDRDPAWDGHNNRSQVPEPQEVTQDFGHSMTQHAGGAAAGEIGGLMTPAGEPAYYAKPIEVVTFDDKFTARGKLSCTGRHFHVLVGFFNAKSANEWRVPNSIVLRLYGRGDVFYAYIEYATSRWRASADSPRGFVTAVDPVNGRLEMLNFPSAGTVYDWTLEYDPAGNDGHGSIRASIGDQTAECYIDPEHRLDGATFNRFGLLNMPKLFDQGGEVWLDDVSINGQTEDFTSEPDWEAAGNRRTYTTTGIRPRFDFGFSETNFAGGERPGELGGVVFRGDCRVPEKMAYYGDRLEVLSAGRPLRAEGKVSLRRGISDSTTLIGFFNARDAVAVRDSQSTGFPVNFLGAAIEGPSREGFLFYSVYHFPNGASANGSGAEAPHILPDGSQHTWSLNYDPRQAKLTTALDGKAVTIDVDPSDLNAKFDRFGIVTTWVDGNSQNVYFDDLTYTWRQE